MSAAQAATKPSMPPNLDADGNFTRHPSDVLIDLIAALLVPMFLGSTNGDPRFARLAALETVNSYRAATQADLISVLQIIALGLASAQAACLSMTPDLPIATTMQLFGYADRLNRSAIARGKYREQERRQRDGVAPVQAKAAVAAQASPPPAAAASPPPLLATPVRPHCGPGADAARRAAQDHAGAETIAALAEILGHPMQRDPRLAVLAHPDPQEATVRAQALTGVAQALLDGVGLPTAAYRPPCRATGSGRPRGENHSSTLGTDRAMSQPSLSP